MRDQRKDRRDFAIRNCPGAEGTAAGCAVFKVLWGRVLGRRDRI